MAKNRRKLSPSPSQSTSATSYSISDDQSDSSSNLRKRRRDRDDDKRRSKKSRRDDKKSNKKKKHSSRRRRDRDDNRKSRDKKKRKRKYYSDSDSDSDDEKSAKSDSESERPEDVVKLILKEFPDGAGDLQELLQSIDDGQGVDLRGLAIRSLVKPLRRLFISLNLEEHEHKFFLPKEMKCTLDVVGSVIRSHVQPSSEVRNLDSRRDAHVAPMESEHVTENVDDLIGPGPKRRVIGPQMPSAELLAAAAKLTEAEAELREAELDGDTGLFIGPPPPAVVKEAASANEAERFEEITRIIGAEEASPYDVLGVNHNMAAENMKKRYWKLSLMVHPDKCAHPQAQQAFVKLNKAFKDLQDPDKRKALDDKIKQKEEQEAFQVELKAMREAAQWRRLQGISMEGDDILLAEMDAKEAKKRDEWMTTLPPERKPGGATQQSTRSFSKNAREGRGDTSAWTDTPSERAQKAKMNYLEAYNEAAALASNERDQKRVNPDAELVEQYNKTKRSVSLVEKHQKLMKKSRSKKKLKQGEPEWEKDHPWRPFDRETDLCAGRQKVNLDGKNMAQGLTSRFSSANYQTKFL